MLGSAMARLIRYHVDRAQGTAIRGVPGAHCQSASTWAKASRGQLDEDPVVYAIAGRRSLLLGILVLAIILSTL